MAKQDTDPVLEQLVHAVNESGQTPVPVTVSAHGTILTGALIAQDAYFTRLAEGAARCWARSSRLRACSARSTPRRSRPKQIITCTSARPEPTGRDCGESA
jgi:hypothetical protein